MEQILSILGFTDTVSVLWHLLAYTAMILITIAVVSEKRRNQFFVLGPLALFFYAWFYLHDSILAGLQVVVATSAVLNLLHVKKSASFIVIGLTIVVFATLLATGQIFGLWAWFSAFGLFGIAFGLTRLPRKQGFVLMALGSLLIAVYSFVFQSWVFFVLSIIFFIANFIELRRK